MSWLSNFFHPQRGFQAARDQLQQGYNQGQGYLNPYNQYGQQAYGQYSGAGNALLDPQSLLAKWIGGYQESPYAKQLEGQATRQGLDAASSLGLNGSSAALSAIQGGTSNIVNADRENYLNRLMQQYLAGAGIQGDIYGRGEQAAGQLSNQANQYGQNQAQLAYGQQNAQGDLIGRILGGIGSAGAGIAGSYFGNPGRWSTSGGQ